MLNETDPKLTTFLNIATQTTRETFHHGLTPKSDISNHSKKICHCFIICLLKNCINPKQSSPLHNLLACIVETGGGSRQLLTVLNRLGCVSSPDTHDQFVTLNAEDQLHHKVWTKIPPNIFTVASVDNFNILQTHSAIYHGTDQRGFHGTTIQLVQPNPEFIITSFSDISHPSNPATLNIITSPSDISHPSNPATLNNT